MTFQQTEQAPLFILVEGGTFTMGSPLSEADREDDETPHQVTVTSFYMGKYEVTQKEWVEVMGSNPSYFKGDDLPVEQVDWYEAVEYCNKRSIKEGLTPAYTVSGTDVTWNGEASGCRLPTEAEWEYAARGGSGAAYQIYSNDADSVGWYSGNSGGKTHQIGTKQPNGLGIYDMSGNVWEWCWDWYDDYPTAPQTDPLGAVTGDDRVIRGGGWDFNVQCLALRGNNYPSGRYSFLGFRLVRPAL
jgi:formylglycine-generating enzyme required for sulfatase activity